MSKIERPDLTVTKESKYGPIAQAVEDLLPTHMMALAITQLYKEGYELRLDARGYLSNAFKAVIERHPGHEAVVARRVDDAAKTVFRGADLGDAKMALLATAYLVLKLVEEGLYLDQTSQAVLTAIMIAADADEDENPENHDDVPTARRKAERMLSECLRAGYYDHTLVRQ